MRIKFIQKIIDKLRNKEGGVRNILYKQSVMEQFKHLQYIFIPALITHKNTFEKYKSIYRDKEVVIVASGPTMKYYNSKMFKEAVHIGVNHTFTQDNVVLDYLFIQDDLNKHEKKQKNIQSNIQNQADSYRKGICKKMYGIHTNPYRICEINALEADAERYYFIDQLMPVSDMAMFSVDITTRPLNEWSSVVFAALEFAFWTHPKKIYLVGCDCSAAGHIYWTKQDELFCRPENRLLYGWHRFKQYKDENYPDIDIVSINPVGLKGLFNDYYTENYLKDHK